MTEPTTDTEVLAKVSAEVHAEVFYDDQCPICRAEIDHYRRLDTKGAIAFTPLSGEGDSIDGIDRAAFERRLHVRLPSGEMVIGVDAFPALWRQLPGWRHLTWLPRVPVVRQLMQLGYEIFLVWQRWHRRRRAG